MAIRFFSEEIKPELKNKRLIKNWIIQAIINEEKIPGQINYIFTSDNYLIEINKKYLSHNYFTDIVTFNFCTDNIINGDIYISLETVKNNSTIFSVSYNNELNRVMIHGVLHLIGFNDSNNVEKSKMREKEDYYLALLKNLS